MLLSDDNLYVLGPDEIGRQKKLFESLTTPESQATVAQQEKALAGELGSKLLVVDAKTGAMKSGASFQSSPVLDGMIGAYGKVFVSMEDGTLTCLGSEGTPLEMLSTEEMDRFRSKSEMPGPVPRKFMKQLYKPNYPPSSQGGSSKKKKK